MSLPKRFPDREEIAAVREEADKLAPGAEADAEHRLTGRVMARRDLGKLVFLDVVDRSGRIQLLVRPDDVGGGDLDLGDIVGVVGVAAKSRRGEPSVAVHKLELLAKIHAPLPDTFHGITDVEQRYRRRYLDLLMNEDARRNAIVRSRMVAAIRAYLDGEGFVEVETTIVHDWPIELSPFARTSDDDPNVVERFECVVAGMEFANAFSEPNDSEEQADRFAMQAAEREAGDVTAEAGDPDFVEAMSYGMPPTGGCGIGIDRLAMAVCEKDAIRDVILFPALRQRS